MSTRHFYFTFASCDAVWGHWGVALFCFAEIFIFVENVSC